MWGCLKQHINRQPVGGPTESRGVEGHGACTASITACIYISWFGLAFIHSYLYHIFSYRDQNHMDDRNSSQGKINVTVAPLWKRRQVVKCLNGGHSCSLLQKLMMFFEVYHEPIKPENTKWGQWSKWHRIAFLPLEFEVQFSTETISVMAIWEWWLSLSLSLQVSSLLDDACTVWNAALISLVITFAVGLKHVI